MTTMQIFGELTKVGGWAHQPRWMRMAASRYYSGADSLEDLRAQAEPQPVSGDTEGERMRAAHIQPPSLTHAQVSEIIMLR